MGAASGQAYAAAGGGGGVLRDHCGSSVLGNPYLRPCHVFSLIVPTPDPGIATSSQSYAVSPANQNQGSGSNRKGPLELWTGEYFIR
ncbi:conserved hypothetical protein [Ricinus communis]|uniref:Uncharacterized protein n=1 Tax=Ricinus communis TaxID=3988 RepID=B9RWE7_RICCO|nr:conserved hypothetical protein [Ricinus communis]